MMQSSSAETTPLPPSGGGTRERVYKCALGLSIVFVADGILMAWALLDGAYAFGTYSLISYFPVFLPALLVALVISGIYVHGFTRLSWTARKAEWLFFFVLADAVAAKIIVLVHRHCCG
jgi:hypothetical protein